MARKTFAIVQQEDVTNISMSVVDNSSPFSAPDIVKSLEFSYKKEKGAKDNEFHRSKGLSQKYTCEEKEVISHDGVKVSLTILFSRTAYHKGGSPGLLHGYAAYSEDLDRSWCPDHLSLLDQGWMFAFADVRGGAGADPSWHQSGRVLNKLNSIYDFVACGKYMINEGLVHRNQLGAVGISAGCLLVGAAVNMHPELFRAAILKLTLYGIPIYLLLLWITNNSEILKRSLALTIFLSTLPMIIFPKVFAVLQCSSCPLSMIPGLVFGKR